MENQSSFPEGSIKHVTGHAMTLKGNDIDTDRIIPARFLKCVSFTYLGKYVFADDRKDSNQVHSFDMTKYKGSSILIVNENFGCGSSREHAPQALMRWGIRAIIGSSFAEIFYGNCLAIGIPCATTSAEKIFEIQNLVDQKPEELWGLDISSKCFSNRNKSFIVNINTGAHQMLLNGRWDATSQLVANSDALSSTMKRLPYLNKFI